MSTQDTYNTAPSVRRFPEVPSEDCGKHRRMRFMRPTLRQLAARARLINRQIAIGEARIEPGKPKRSAFLAYWKNQSASLAGYLRGLKNFCEKTT